MPFFQIRPNTFEWTMPVYWKLLPSSSKVTTTSPQILLPDSTWCLMVKMVIFPSTCEVYLCRKDFGPPKSITYTIKSLSGTQAREVSSTHYFDEKNTISAPLKLDKMAVLSAPILTILCNIEAGAVSYPRIGKRRALHETIERRVISFGIVRPSTFQWLIPNYQEFLQTGGQKIMSPEFDLPDSTWCLVFDFPFVFEESIMIYLLRRDNGPPKSITYTIETRNGTKVSRTHKFVGKNSISGPVKLNKKRLASTSTSDLLITCYINYGILDRKAETKLATCAVQKKELPDCMSRAIQTENANSLIEKEVPKDEESIEMKDVALQSERMKELLIKSSDHDITICVQDKKFRGHRNILSVRSPVFAMMLSHDTKENNTSTINIDDCDPESFDEFLLYVYSGRTENLTPSNALHLYYSADKYDFPVLKERCVNLLKTSLSEESICDVVLLAAKHEEEELLKAATEFFARNMKKILVTVAWQKFMVQNPVEANELILKSVDIYHP